MRTLSPFLLTFLLSLTMAQTPFDEPFVNTLNDPRDILMAMQTAQDTLFVILPSLDNRVLNELLESKARDGLHVYVITRGGSNVNRNLQNAGVNIRTLPRLEQALVMIDYRTLIAGDLLVTGRGEAQLIDTSTYDLSLVNGLRVAWQAATPY